MADSETNVTGRSVDRLPDKRNRLIAAACQLLYQQGVEKTTLADIAHLADVPLGNVYYYFKTKDEIIEAVIESHLQEIRATLLMIETGHRSPKNRLKALVRTLAEQRDLIAEFGCPQGSLCSELDKREAGRDPLAAELIRVPISWAEQQFRSMGRRDAYDLAVTLIAAYQGTALLTSTLSDPSLMLRESRRLTRWIDSLEAN
jgi:AcrR family transcriptional regulator